MESRCYWQYFLNPPRGEGVMIELMPLMPHGAPSTQGRDGEGL